MTGLSGGLRDLIGDPRHVASVRRVTFEDGPERGLEALLMTAGPLSMTVLAGRSMDIGAISWRGVPVGWTGPAGFPSAAHINPDADGGRGFARALSGFLITGGMTHIRQPTGHEPMHGLLPFTPARLIGAGEDWDRGLIWCEGETRQVRHGRETLLLRRRIELTLSGDRIRIRDTVTNEGAAEITPELLYHINLGYPAIADGTTIRLDGETVMAPITMPSDSLPPPPTWFRPRGVSAICNAETSQGGQNFSLAVEFSSETLECLQLWCDLRPRSGLVCIEPCSSHPDGRSPPLGPGSARSYRLDLTLAGGLSLPALLEAVSEETLERGRERT